MTVSYVLLAIFLLCPIEPPQHAQQLAEEIFAEASTQDNLDHQVALTFHALKCGWPESANYCPSNRRTSVAQAFEYLRHYTFNACFLRDIDSIRNERFDQRQWMLQVITPSHHELDQMWFMWPVESTYSDRSIDCIWSHQVRRHPIEVRQWRRSPQNTLPGALPASRARSAPGAALLR